MFDDEDIVSGCKFFLPTSITDTVRRCATPFGYKRKDITFKKFKKVVTFLRKEGVVTMFSDGISQPNSLPKFHFVSAIHSKKIKGSSLEYGKPTGKALSVVVGELLERYFTCEEQNRSYGGNIHDSLLKKIPLKDFNAYIQEQCVAFPEYNQKKQECYSHTICKRLSTNEEVLIPSQFAFWFPKGSSETRLVHQTSSGGGAFYNKEGATLSGLYELIERDNFLLMWLTKESKECIEIESIPKDRSICHLIEKVRSMGVDIYFIRMTRDIPIQSICCLIIDTRNNFPIVSFGASAGPNLEYCLESSLLEAFSTLNLNTTKNTIIDFSTYKPYLTKKIQRTERLTLWKGDLVRKLHFLYSGERVSFGFCEKNNLNFRNKKEELNYLVHLLEKKGEGYEVYVHETQSVILKKLGFFVVKVIVPKLFPLYLEETSATLSSDRLAEALGVEKKDIKLSMLNPYPHPFP